MIEALALSLALVCPQPTADIHPLAVRLALHAYRDIGTEYVDGDSEWAYVFGSTIPNLPTAPPENPNDLAYGVWVDPIYEAECFSEFVEGVLSDSRSWPNLRMKDSSETPQFWITLVAPGQACGNYKWPHLTCAWNNGDGTGVVTINALQWNRGYPGEASLKDARTLFINHEVGHLLGFGHYHCSVMSWRDPCFPVAWPIKAERDLAVALYSERWMLNGEGPWNGAEFTNLYGLETQASNPFPID